MHKRIAIVGAGAPGGYVEAIRSRGLELKPSPALLRA
jgi:hypothetical protein